ncbi:MAG: 30S ribosomal protein S23 [Candidatus Amesbacteria bacterium GW2011_GWA2_47_11b]|uniref:30S ribosomal protein S23 n=2 Tax=Candidatus Amesiibacteriota TaxID=1752730 RepID=A0A0G1RHB3_9BACT|nr:MAG: 30S ribosomal protein S23 [Microgenomates group bacterium GW2011_GWC1_46_20]KKU56669.1 MAG: 30S ribosomal protein S23 [Candidatus Amesbacteria bacterium GW2011_GWA2_47_11b]KKU83011.1 MAG: 30S ribosomal protein S23 [Candidatus Amesbacteria bacterium GW2011_GWC2_47_8]
MLNFERLIVWQKAIDYAEKLVRIADSLPQKYQYSFADQLRRAALSIPNNIAEGAGRSTSRDRANFYSIAKGSVYETVNIVKLLEKLGLVQVTELYEVAEEICKMLYGLAK